jgi:hypothetical protein
MKDRKDGRVTVQSEFESQRLDRRKVLYQTTVVD